MAIRRRVAERFSTVKKRAGLETPILGEVPLVAEVLERFELPKGVIPAMARGKAYGEVAGLWYRVRFPRPIYEPIVVYAFLLFLHEVLKLTLFLGFP